jgi:hypothetical protein
MNPRFDIDPDVSAASTIDKSFDLDPTVLALARERRRVLFRPFVRDPGRLHSGASGTRVPHGSAQMLGTQRNVVQSRFPGRRIQLDRRATP